MPLDRRGSPNRMILIGQYDLPFVRRVGIALTLYDMGFEHKPWSTFGDWQQIAPFNPLTRVPTLALDNGEVLLKAMPFSTTLTARLAQRAPCFRPGRGAAPGAEGCGAGDWRCRQGRFDVLRKAVA